MFVNFRFSHLTTCDPVFVGRCHHGMARPQVADGGEYLGLRGTG